MGPLKFAPLLKRARWGGRKLGSVLGKPIGDESDFAESWELCDHRDDQTLVSCGPFAGQSLRQLVREQGPALLGRQAGADQFPLLIKFLDARDRLSVQVHPNDRQAAHYLPAERGKTEAWVIVAAEPGSCVYAGLRAGVTEADLRAAVATGQVQDLLHRLEVTEGDCLLIPAGTVHAIGEGILLAEVQQTSDLTFRLYDWGRLGADGRPRELHVDRALECTDFARGPIRLSVPEPLATGALRSERLLVCDYFTIRRHQIDKPFELPAADHCRILIGLEGAADCQTGADRLAFGRGETILIPATAPPSRLVPEVGCTFLEVGW